MKFIKAFFLSILITFLSLTLSIFLSRLILTFAVPSQSPPFGNVEAPLTKLNFTQTKKGTLTVLGEMYATILRDYDDPNYYINPSSGATAANLAGPINMNGNRIINVEDPVNPNDAATKAYVDRVLGP